MIDREVRGALVDLFDMGVDYADHHEGKAVIPTRSVDGTLAEVRQREVSVAAALVDQAYTSRRREDDRRARDMLRELRGSGFVAAMLAIATFATSASVDRWLMGVAIVVLLLPQIVRAETPDPGEDDPATDYVCEECGAPIDSLVATITADGGVDPDQRLCPPHAAAKTSAALAAKTPAPFVDPRGGRR
jgi:hypothetical protein